MTTYQLQYSNIYKRHKSPIKLVDNTTVDTNKPFDVTIVTHYTLTVTMTTYTHHCSQVECL